MAEPSKEKINEAAVDAIDFLAGIVKDDNYTDEFRVRAAIVLLDHAFPVQGNRALVATETN